jgi:hypothetical protein
MKNTSLLTGRDRGNKNIKSNRKAGEFYIESLVPVQEKTIAVYWRNKSGQAVLETISIEAWALVASYSDDGTEAREVRALIVSSDDASLIPLNWSDGHYITTITESNYSLKYEDLQQEADYRFSMEQAS